MMEQTITEQLWVRSFKKRILQKNASLSVMTEKKPKEKMSSYQLSFPATIQENKTKRHHD